MQQVRVERFELSTSRFRGEHSRTRLSYTLMREKYREMSEERVVLRFLAVIISNIVPEKSCQRFRCIQTSYLHKQAVAF